MKSIKALCGRIYDKCMQASFLFSAFGILVLMRIVLLIGGIKSHPALWSVYQWVVGSSVSILAISSIYKLLLKWETDDERGRLRNLPEESIENHLKDIEEKFQVSRKSGFLVENPTEQLPIEYREYESLACELLSLVEKRQLRQRVLQLKVDADKLDVDKLTTGELLLAHLILSFITMGYVWQDGVVGVVKTLPRCLAVPLYRVSEKLGNKPAINYATMILANWKMKEDGRSYEPLYSFPGGVGTSWFIHIHTCMEREFAPAVKLVCLAIIYAEKKDVQNLTETLSKMPVIFKNVVKVFRRIEEQLDPVEFYTGVRLFLTGWNNKVMPEGLIYEGVNDDKPMKVGGASGAQSVVLRVIDSTLGIQHGGETRRFYDSEEQYMLQKHRDFIRYVRHKSSVREVAFLVIGFTFTKRLRSTRKAKKKEKDSQVKGSNNNYLKVQYNKCIHGIVSFRSFHFKRIVTMFILKQQQNEEGFGFLKHHGSGGTALVEFLNSVILSTKQAEIELQ